MWRAQQDGWGAEGIELPRQFLPLAWAGMPKTSFRKNSGTIPLDVLKIDQAFMRQLETEKNSQAIVKAILALANGLGMETVAEGVETLPQLEFLKNREYR